MKPPQPLQDDDHPPPQGRGGGGGGGGGGASAGLGGAAGLSLYYDTDGRIVLEREREDEEGDVMKSLSKSFELFPALVSAVRCGVVWCGVVWCGAVRYGAAQCGTVR